MSEEVIKVLDNLGEKFGVAIDWTSENVMPYLQELSTRFIKYKITTEIIKMIICVILIFLASIAIKKLMKWFKSEKYGDGYDNDTIFCVSMVCCIFAIILCLIFAIETIYGIIECIYMPEIVILEYINILV